MLKLNNYMTWNEIVKKYPDKWVMITDAELDESGRVIAGNLIVVCTDFEFGDAINYVVELTKREKITDVLRTTLAEDGIYYE